MAHPRPSARIYEGLDDQTDTLALRLQIEDIDNLLAAPAKDATRNAAGLTEWEQTMLVHKEELQRNLSIIRDRQLSHSLAIAVLQDANAIADLVAEERQAERDRAMACRLAGIFVPLRLAIPAPPPLPMPQRPAEQSAPITAHPALPTPVATPPVTRSTTEQSNSRKRGREDEDEVVGPPQKRLNTGETNFSEAQCPAKSGTISALDTTTHVDVLAKVTASASGSPEENPELKPCISCSDDFNNDLLAHMPCGHDYCSDCLQTVVINALVDEALYPPRCCRQPFDMDSMRPFLPPEIISGFHLKKTEYGTSNRIYCSNAICSSFLYPDNIAGDKAKCPLCFTLTCTICKAPAHIGDCPQDGALQEVLSSATGEGWKRCGNCKAMVELRTGCNHITCRCKAEWCYVCGATWKRCQCPQWQEAMLLERAARAAGNAEGQLPQAPAVVPAQLVAPAPAPVVPVPAQIATARHHVLARHHDCDHDNWVKEWGESSCDECRRD